MPIYNESELEFSFFPGLNSHLQSAAELAGSPQGKIFNLQFEHFFLV